MEEYVAKYGEPAKKKKKIRKKLKHESDDDV